MANSSDDNVSVLLNRTVLTPKETCEVLIEDVEALVEAGVLNRGQGNSLIRKLDAILAKLARGRINAACNQLEAFIGQVNSLIGEGVLPAGDGQPLIDTASNVRDALGCVAD